MMHINHVANHNSIASYTTLEIENEMKTISLYRKQKKRPYNVSYMEDLTRQIIISWNYKHCTWILKSIMQHWLVFHYYNFMVF